MGIEDTPTEVVPVFLSEEETNLFNGLISGCFQSSRLEQERLSSDYIKHQLSVWLTK
ncbi:Wadjet anti-phage system protein JetD domain-containing protein [Xenorhabdus sp. SGI246]|uniref:Wadjet anti-phage system protein JetD domain-containing protein n=1 Tax=Xenorhabdus sp. SGI246 TaxID=3158263 RepID=UPI00349F9DF1